MVAHKNIVWSAHRVFLRTGSDVPLVLAIIGTWMGNVLPGLGRHFFGRNRSLGVRRGPHLAVDLEGSM